MYKKYLISILTFILYIALGSIPAMAKEKTFTIVIDAGHGGHDTGAVDNGTREKDINLGVALALGNMIEKNLKNVKVVYTRKDDTFKSLQQRADIANSAKGDLFISIHTNSVDKKNKNRASVAGTSVYVLGLHKDDNNMSVARRENSVIQLEDNYEQTYKGFDPNLDESYIIFEMAQKKNLSKSFNFAADVQKQIVAVANRKDRGVHQAGFWVLWATSMPAVLIELDFICNPNSAKFMTSSEGKEKFAKSIFNAVKKYVERDKASGINVIEDVEENDAAIPILASVKADEKKIHKYSPPSRNNGNRRRRGSSGRRAQDDQSFEVSSIILHEENEDVIEENAIVAVSSEEVYANVETPAEIPSKKKSEKKRRNKAGSRVQHLRTIYSIHVLSSKEQLGISDPKFHGLSPISVYKENNTYNYMYGEHSSRRDAEKVLKDIRKDFPDARIIESYKNQ